MTLAFVCSAYELGQRIVIFHVLVSGGGKFEELGAEIQARTGKLS